MSASPVALNSCTVTWRDPGLTSPVGRLQGDVKLYPYGGLQEFCDADNCLLGPDGKPLRGLGIHLRDVDQTVTEDPPGVVGDGCYENPLRIDSDGCLWVKQAPVHEELCRTYSQSGVFTQGGAERGDREVLNTLSFSIANPTCGRVKVLRKVSWCSAEISDPPSDTNVPADFIYELQADNQICGVVRAQTGNSDVDTGTFEFEPVFIDPDELYLFQVSTQLQTRQPASGEFLVNRGRIKLCLQIVEPLTNDLFAEG